MGLAPLASGAGCALPGGFTETGVRRTNTKPWSTSSRHRPLQLIVAPDLCSPLLPQPQQREHTAFIVTSVVSDSVRPHRRQPTRLPCPWDSPGKNSGVGCHFLLQCMKVKSESQVAQSCPTFSDPMDCSPPSSSVHGIFQARVLEWGAIAFSAPFLRAVHIR